MSADVVGGLEGRRALVTGAGQGIGRGIALSLAARGASVALVGRTAAKLDQVRAELKAIGSSAVTALCDVKDGQQVLATVDAVIDQLGGLDILVNNAQEQASGSLLDASDAEFTAAWESGPLAAFRFMRACHPHLRGHGVIVNIGSGAAVNPARREKGTYAAAKAAAMSLSRTAGVEWAGDGIRTIAVLPIAATPEAARAAQGNVELYEQAVASIPLRRLGDPEKDIGKVVALLCTDDASYMTATTVALDGGQAFLR